MTLLSDLSVYVDCDAELPDAERMPAAPPAHSSADKQLLRGMATKAALRGMLHDLSLRPSHKHVYAWLQDYCMSAHATDLTREGSVEHLLTCLGSHPLHIRGGALVDPRELEKELRARTAKITAGMARGFRDHLLEEECLLECFTAGCSVVEAGFFERCLKLDLCELDPADDELADNDE